MAITITKININNKKIDNSVMTVPLDVVTVNWEVATTTQSIKQLSYEIRIASHNINWGTSSFISDIIRQPFARDRSQYWRLKPKFLSRGQVYYGQIRVKDTTNEQSEWAKFSFFVNRLPFLTFAKILPELPGENQDLELSLGVSSEASIIKTKWFRNGIHYDQFDNYQKISREYLKFGDTWYAEVTPFDEFEKGSTIFAKAVSITKKPPVANELQILPLNPNVNDILEASYVVKENNTLLLKDHSNIRWYINNELITEANDLKFVKFNLKPEDTVHFSIIPGDGIFYGEMVVSKPVEIQESGFRVVNLRVDGAEENLSVNGVNPTVEWDVIQPFNKQSKYANIKIGTAPGANNIYNYITETYDNKFTIPDNIIRRGFDYYVSVSSSDQRDLFKFYETSKFRVAGNLWNKEVNNSLGWTIEVSLSVSDDEGYQKLSLSDGSKFAELRFYKNNLQLLLGNSVIKNFACDLLIPQNIIIIGKSSTIKVFLNNLLVLDGSGLFVQNATERFIEIGSSGDSEIKGKIKRVTYNVDGYYEPGSSVYSDIKLEKMIDFSGSSISDIVEHKGDVLVSVNPFNSSESGQLYKIIETERPIVASTESIDSFDMQINSLSISPFEKIMYIGHSKGASFFDNYFIPQYDSSSVFIAGFDPSINLWELTKTTSFVATKYIQEGLVIDTTLSNRVSSLSAEEVLVTKTVPSLIFVSIYDTIFSYDFDIVVSNNILSIYLKGTTTEVYVTSLIGKTIDQLVTELKSLKTSENYFFSLFYEIYSTNEIGPQVASRLNKITRTNMFPNITLNGEYEVADPYNPNPYGTLSTGKWFYSHRKKGTPWFENVDNSKGWTIDFDLRIDSVEDSDTPSNTADPRGAGFYINDGRCSQNLYFLPQEIVFEGYNQSFVYDTTDLTSYRIVGKNTKIKLYGKKILDQSYNLIAEVPVNQSATNQGNAGRPSVVSDDSGYLHAVWHDDGKGKNRRQIYYSKYSPSEGWSEPKLVVSDQFSSSNPDIAIDSNDNIYIVYETTKSDYTDISVITNRSGEWSEPYFLTSNLYDSFSPKITIDYKNNVHIVWEDYRSSQPQIFYCKRNSANGQWESSIFGGQDMQITMESVGAKRPAIISSNNSVYVVWTSFTKSGTSSIKLATYDIGLRSWRSSGQGGSDFAVSGVSSFKADNADISIDLKGQIVVVWNDVVGNNYQIFGRFINSRLVFAKDVLQLTKGDYDSTHPKCGLDTLNGDIYVVFEKQQEKIDSPYNPYSARESDVSFKSPAIYLLKWDALSQSWFSSNQSKPSSETFSFDVEFDFGLPRQSYRPSISNKFNGSLHILFESNAVSISGEILSNNDLFSQIRDLVYDFSFESIYDISSHAVYGAGELQLNGNLNRKELRFGDFSNNLSLRMVVGSIKYYLSDAVEPFSINLVSSTTTNMPNTSVLTTFSNDNGDAWFGTSDGLIFYNRKSNQSYLLNSEESNIKGLKISCIVFDKKSNMYIATNNGVYGSVDHSYFSKLSGLPNKINTLEVGGNYLYVGSDVGFYIINLNDIYSKLIVTKSNVSDLNRSIEISNIVHFDKSNGLPSDKINVIKVDSNNVAWIGSDKGLIRYNTGEISTFTTANGLYSNKINDISIRNTAIRYIATTAGVNKMTGISINPLNFDNTNSVPASINGQDIGDINLPVFINAKSVKWKDPNILWISSNYNIFQITFIEESFTTEKTITTKFTSSDFTLSSVVHFRNDDLQSFKIIGLDDEDIPSNALFEVTLNGNKITRGFTFSAKNKLIRFHYPLSETDIVKINIRKDIEKIGDFKQNKAQQIAEGNKSSRLSKILSANGSIYALVNGDNNSLQINDQASDLPFDKIILDKTPPKGKINLGNRRERSTFEVNITPLDSDTEGVFDETSGIDKMIVSNFENFTSDGETALAPMVFTRFLLHNLGEIFDNVTKQLTIPLGKGKRLIKYQPVGKNPTIIAATSDPACVYKYNNLEQKWEKIDTLDVVNGSANSSSSVEFLIQYQDKIYAGTGNVNGLGKIWVMNSETFKFDLIRTLPSNTHAYSAVVFDNVLYIGGGGGSYGALYSYDGTSTNEVFKNVGGAIYSLVESNREIYAATGYEGRIYKLDPKNKTQQIIDNNSDRNVISIANSTVNGQNYIFAGFGSNGQIKRSKIPNSPFVHSFRTVPSAVNSIKNINNTLYSAIGNTLYTLQNVWTAKYVHTEDIKDVCEGLDSSVWFISDSYIYKIGKAEDVKRVYLKLIDKAGNETNLYKDESQKLLDENLFDEINISDLSSFINKNRIIKVNEFGNAVTLREGNDRFYSSDVIEEEIGEYYSEIFNGTNNLVSWDKISWDAVIPENTSVTVYVRTGSTKKEIVNNEFIFSINGKDGVADISFLSGQFIQFKIVMKSRVRSLTPTLKNVVIKSISSDSTHFFTTNFILPSRVKGGILTSTKLLPVAADIVFGINTNNSTDFAEYQIIDENRIFTTESEQIGSGLRVGIRFITPSRFEVSDEVPGEYSPYGLPLLFNSVEWSYQNVESLEANYDFKVSFYDDHELTNLVYVSNTKLSTAGFSVDGEIFPTGGSAFSSLQSRDFSFTPVGATTLKCNTYYYVKIESIKGDNTSLVSSSHAFIQSCGTTYVDVISFDFVNTSQSLENYHFRIRFYNDPERTDLKYTAFSGNDLSNWTVGELAIPVEGVQADPGEVLTVNYSPLLSNIDAGKIYYLSIDVYNGEIFENNSNSFSFKANDLNSQIYCGSYSNVPVIKNFAIMFELENNEFISMKVDI